jgi:cysteine synthase A
MRGAVLLAEKMVAEQPSRFLLLQQFKNPANPAIHEQTTGPEIWEATNGEIDIFAAGVGTGGTITGVARYIKKTCGKPIKIVAIELRKSGDPTNACERKLTPPRRAFKESRGFVPETLDLSLVDEAVSVNLYDAYDYAKRLARKKAPLRHFRRANVAVAARGAESENVEKLFVTIIPDSAEATHTRYLE